MTGLNTSGVCPTFISLVLFECIESVCLQASPPRRCAALRNKSNALRVIVADVEMNGVGGERTIVRGQLF
jgi:hypothetical protein